MKCSKVYSFCRILLACLLTLHKHEFSGFYQSQNFDSSNRDERERGWKWWSHLINYHNGGEPDHQIFTWLGARTDCMICRYDYNKWIPLVIIIIQYSLSKWDLDFVKQLSLPFSLSSFLYYLTTDKRSGDIRRLEEERDDGKWKKSAT